MFLFIIREKLKSFIRKFKINRQDSSTIGANYKNNNANKVKSNEGEQSRFLLKLQQPFSEAKNEPGFKFCNKSKTLNY